VLVNSFFTLNMDFCKTEAGRGNILCYNGAMKKLKKFLRQNEGMKKAKKFFILGGIFLVLAIVFTIFVKTFDVAESGATQTPVGFSHLNESVFEAIGVNFSMYEITNFVGYVPILFVFVYGAIGLYQWIDRKSLKKVDLWLYVLCGMFAIATMTYIFFEITPVNYRPVLMDGSLDPSYPSSHTLMSLCFAFGIILANCMFCTEKKWALMISGVLGFCSTFILVGRFLSGVHWATDIIASIIFSVAYIAIYYGCLVLLKSSLKLAEK